MNINKIYIELDIQSKLIFNRFYIIPHKGLSKNLELM